MDRVLIAPTDWAQNAVALSDEDAHHLLHVRRCGNGQAVEVFDGAGRYAMAVVQRAGRQGASLIFSDPPLHSPEWLPRITLIQAPPKGKRMELLIEKTTELGVSGIVPAITERTISRQLTGEEACLPARWKRIAASACCQCGRYYMPALAAPAPLAEALRQHSDIDLLLYGSIEQGVPLFREVLQQSAVTHPAHIAMAIGPEGDFSADECALLRSAGALPVSFGSTVLRVETAGIYAVAILTHTFRSG